MDNETKKIRKKTIKISWLDTWWGDDNTELCKQNRVYKLLSKHYDLQFSDKPDYIIDGGQGMKYLSKRYERAIKILVNGENFVPDFNFFDYASGFDHLSFGDRFIRQPWFAFYDEFYKMSSRIKNMPTDDYLLNRDFCSFVVSNGEGGDPFRTLFFRELSKYKKVASGGRYLNNIGGPIKNKCDFCSRYKFNIAFENSVSPGYTTEKIMEPLTVYSVPIYYGNPTVEEDFYEDCMVRVKNKKEMKDVIERIVALDKDDNAYLAKVHSRCMVHDVEWWDNQLENFLVHIIDQPIERARRTMDYGFQPIVRNRFDRLYRLGETWEKVSGKFQPVRALGRRIESMIKH